MSSCQTFRNTLGNIKPEDLQGLFETYLSTGAEDSFIEGFQSIKDKQEKLILDYQTKVRQLLIQWYQTTDRVLKKGFSDGISFEEGSQRVIVKSSVYPPDETNYFPHVIKEVDGNISLSSHRGITEIDFLEIVHGYLDIEDCEGLSSMARLREVGQALSISNTNLQSLPKLEKVVGQLNISRWHVTPEINIATFFPNLKEVGDNNPIAPSFYVNTESQKRQVEELQAQGKIKILGEIAVWSS